MIASLLRRFRRDDRAIAAIEFAIIVPVVLALAATTLEFGMYYRALDAVNKLAAQYAIAWADCAGATECQAEANVFSSTTLANNLTSGSLVAANLSFRLYQAKRQNSTTLYAPTVAIPSATVPDSNEKAAILNKVETNEKFGVVVTITYTHVPQFFASTANAFLAPYLTIRARVAQLQDAQT